MWLEFPLALLFLHVLPPKSGLASAVILWAIAAFVPAWLHPDTWHSSAAIGPAIGTVFAVAIYRAYRSLHQEAERHRRIALQLRATQEELAATEHQAGRLEERERLSREIHDTVAQGLSSILLVSRAAKASAREYPELHSQLSTIEEVAAENLAEARRFVRDLASPELEESLTDALAGVVRRMRQRGEALGESTEFQLFSNGDTQRTLPQPVAAAAIRAAQEGLSNVVKHAQADKAVVTLGIFDESVTVDVVDNGRGTDAPRGYGLTGLARRISTLNGIIDVESTPGQGTALTVSIPLTSRTQPAPKTHNPGGHDDV